MVRSSAGHTARDLARSSRHAEIEALLVRAEQQRAGPHQLYVSSQSTMSGAWTSVGRVIYIDTPTTALTIDRGGTGTGGITATGLSCPGGSPTQALPCGASYPLHTVVTLTAAPDPGSTFDGWGGACAGTGTCQVTIANARYVTAAFAKIPNTIATRYYHTDVVGSVRAITDETGAVVLRLMARGPTPTPFVLT